MPANCRNCDSVIPDYSPCPYCEYAHVQLLERLADKDDGAVDWWVVAVWANRFKEPERRYGWRVG